MLWFPTGGIGYLYGINQNVVNNRIRMRKENPEYDNAALRKKRKNI